MKKYTLNEDGHLAVEIRPSLPVQSGRTGGTPGGRRVRPRLQPTGILLGAIGLLAGCASEPDSHLVSSPPPPPPTASPGAYATPAPTATVVQVPMVTATPPGSAIIVAQAPPSAPPEAVPPRPTTDNVWVPGYWTWRNERYEWMAGHWEVPPSSATAWIPPRWEPESGSYRFYEGYWK